MLATSFCLIDSRRGKEWGRETSDGLLRRGDVVALLHRQRAMDHGTDYPAFPAGTTRAVHLLYEGDGITLHQRRSTSTRLPLDNRSRLRKWKGRGLRPRPISL